MIYSRVYGIMVDAAVSYLKIIFLQNSFRIVCNITQCLWHRTSFISFELSIKICDFDFFFIIRECDELTETSRNIFEVLLRTLAKMPHHLSNVIKTKQLCVF